MPSTSCCGSRRTGAADLCASSRVTAGRAAVVTATHEARRTAIRPAAHRMVGGAREPRAARLAAHVLWPAARGTASDRMIGGAGDTRALEAALASTTAATSTRRRCARGATTRPCRRIAPAGATLVSARRRKACGTRREALATATVGQVGRTLAFRARARTASRQTTRAAVAKHVGVTEDWVVASTRTAAIQCASAASQSPGATSVSAGRGPASALHHRGVGIRPRARNRLRRICGGGHERHRRRIVSRRSDALCFGRGVGSSTAAADRRRRAGEPDTDGGQRRRRERSPARASCPHATRIAFAAGTPEAGALKGRRGTRIASRARARTRGSDT